MKEYCRRKTTDALQEEKYWISHCFSKSRNLCCKQVLHLQYFKTSVTQKTENISHDLNWKSKLSIYLMECRICPIQYIGKSEIEFNTILNNHCKDVNRQNAPQANQHFKLPYQNVNQHARFTLIEQLDNVNIEKDLVLKTWNRLDRNTKNYTSIQLKCWAFSQPIIKNPFIFLFGTCTLMWFS